MQVPVKTHGKARVCRLLFGGSWGLSCQLLHVGHSHSLQCVAGVLVAAAAAIAADLPAIHCSGSSLKTDPQQNDGHGCFRSRGGRWVSKRARKPALVKYEGGIRMNSNASGAPLIDMCSSLVKAQCALQDSCDAC
jgi:hypothetical protein